LGETTALVAGHSWAGGVALQSALDFPELVAGVALISPVVPDEPPSRVDRLLAEPFIGTALACVALGTAGRLVASSPGRALVGRQLQSRQDEVARLGAPWHHPSAWRSFSVEQRALIDELPLLAPRLASLRAPVAVVVGSADRVTGASAAKRLAAEIDGATFEVVAGAGHPLPQLRPAVVTAALRRLAARACWP
ncbi:MAG TPA: alpha/beta hydrolase, partial [Acidimicrobiales bacterium]|nr:alpha/beta hydrolase [Acidimicrobiales bacterium]